MSGEKGVCVRLCGSVANLIQVKIMIKRVSAILLLLTFALLSTGCSKSILYKEKAAPGITTPPAVVGGQGGCWWSARFRIAWPPESSPRWSMGLLLADMVVEPALLRFHDNIKFWRFHRRAMRDNTGHQFSFLFYSDSSVASGIFKAIGDNQVLEELLARALIDEVKVDDTSHPVRYKIEATSDSHWSLTLQKAWPAFIMGASAMWLGLINQYVEEGESRDLDIDSLLERYDEVNKSVGNIWTKEGQHAFFHHLSAVFGYEPLIIKRKVRF